MAFIGSHGFSISGIEHLGALVAHWHRVCTRSHPFSRWRRDSPVRRLASPVAARMIPFSLSSLFSPIRLNPGQKPQVPTFVEQLGRYRASSNSPVGQVPSWEPKLPAWRMNLPTREFQAMRAIKARVSGQHIHHARQPRVRARSQPLPLPTTGSDTTTDIVAYGSIREVTRK